MADIFLPEIIFVVSFEAWSAVLYFFSLLSFWGASAEPLLFVPLVCLPTWCPNPTSLCGKVLTSSTCCRIPVEQCINSVIMPKIICAECSHDQCSTVTMYGPLCRVHSTRDLGINVRPLEVHGLGVFATRILEKDTCIDKYSVITLIYQEAVDTCGRSKHYSGKGKAKIPKANSEYLLQLTSDCCIDATATTS